MPWSVRLVGAFHKCLRRYKADKAVLSNYRQFIVSLARSDSPASMGVPKRGKYRGCLGAHITKSVVVAYRIDYDARRIDLLKTGTARLCTGKTGEAVAGAAAASSGPP